VSVNEEVTQHFSPFSNSFEALKKLKKLYDSHFELDVIQLTIKLFNLELKNDDPLALESEIRSIFHDIKAPIVEIDVPLITYVKALYPTYSHYVESFHASGKPEEIAFDSL